MHWNSIVRLLTALGVYLTLVIANLTGLSPIGFALLTAIVLSLGLWAHSVDQRLLLGPDSDESSLTPSTMNTLSESMDQLRALQLEIDALQAQFVRDTDSLGSYISPNSPAS